MDLEHLISVDRAASFAGMGRVMTLIMKFVNKLKMKLKNRDPVYPGFVVVNCVC